MRQLRHTAALRYAQFGWKSFPIHRKNKRPACAKGFKAATDNPFGLRKLFTETGRILGDGLAIATGGRSKLVVLDVDCRKAEELGYDPLECLMEMFGDEWTDTLTARTQNGGYHFYFQKPKRRRLPSKVGVFPGVDVKAENGYVIAPPTEGYAWQTQSDDGLYLHDPKLLPTPKWLLEALGKPKDARPAVSLAPDVDKVVRFPLIRQVLRNCAKKVRDAQKGSRKWTLTQAAYVLGRWIPNGLDHSIAFHCLMSASDDWRDIPRADRERRVQESLKRGYQATQMGDYGHLAERAVRELNERAERKKARVAFLASLKVVRSGTTIQEVLDQYRGWRAAFEGEKAARNAIAKVLRCHGYVRKRQRVKEEGQPDQLRWIWVRPE